MVVPVPDVRGQSGYSLTAKPVNISYKVLPKLKIS